jgi:hypothetical protein
MRSRECRRFRRMGSKGALLHPRRLSLHRRRSRVHRASRSLRRSCATARANRAAAPPPWRARSRPNLWWVLPQLAESFVCHLFMLHEATAAASRAVPGQNLDGLPASFVNRPGAAPVVLHAAAISASPLRTEVNAATVFKGSMGVSTSHCSPSLNTPVGAAAGVGEAESMAA